MKIDFNGSYKSLAKIIFAKDLPENKPVKASEFSEQFEAVARLNPKTTEILSKTEQLTNIEKPKPAPQIAQTELPFDDKLPKITQPVPKPREPHIELTQEIQNESNGVKTPTVVSARRISVPASSVENEKYSASTFQPLIKTVGIKHGIDPVLGMAIAKAESSFNPTAVSNDGHYSKGLFQLLDSTGKDMMGRLSKTGNYDPFNPELNTDLGLGYLRYLHDLFSSSTELPNKGVTLPAANSSSLEKLAVAAYNAGEGRVASAQKRAKAAGKEPGLYDHIEQYLPKITQQYVKRVTSFKTNFISDSVEEFNG